MIRPCFGVFCVLMIACAGLARSEDDGFLKEQMSTIPMPAGWKCAGDAKVYDPATLAELTGADTTLYFEFGFKRAVAVNYLSEAKPAGVVRVETYEFGSPLDAFGMYSNCRDADSKAMPVGTAGFSGNSQVIFYQDCFLVKVGAAGASLEHRAALLPCAKAVSTKLPRNTEPPEELELLKISTVIPQTEQYHAQGLLGYDFFTCGLSADASLNDKRVKVFIVIETRPKTARLALQRYKEHLSSSRGSFLSRSIAHGDALFANDPQHRGVLIQQIGFMLVGVADLPEASAGIPLLEKLYEHAAEIMRNSLSPDRMRGPDTSPQQE